MFWGCRTAGRKQGYLCAFSPKFPAGLWTVNSHLFLRELVFPSLLRACGKYRFMGTSVTPEGLWTTWLWTSEFPPSSRRQLCSREGSLLRHVAGVAPGGVGKWVSQVHE